MTNKTGRVSKDEARALRHWADFGLVYPRTPGFGPGSPTPGHEVAPPTFRVGADVPLILYVESVIAAARKLAQTDARDAGAKAREEARRAARVAGLPVGEDVGRREAARASERHQVTVCGLRAILALAYSPIRGHAELERILGTYAAEQLRDDAEDYYMQAASTLERPVWKSRPASPSAQQRVQVQRSLAQTMTELKQLVKQLGLCREV